MMIRPFRSGRRVLAVVATAVLLVLTASVGPAHAQRYLPIDGSGSTWSANAINQWVADVKNIGIQVNYSSVGSSRGRQDFANKITHFGVSEIPYGLKDANGATDSPLGRGYAYMPIVAGGTAFMYHLTVGGQLVRNLRLSGPTITKIFTGQITNWSDPAITADNNGRALPSKKIIPIIRSDGSGTSAQFSGWMRDMHGDIWKGGMTSYFPAFGGSVAKSSSIEMATYISAQFGEGAIGYVEYSYARAQNYPVAKVLNAHGYFTEPTDYNVAVALQGAKIDETNPNDPSTYLTQKLDDVYRYKDDRAYPLSSYSYMILPTKVEAKVNTDVGYTLGAFAYYFLCQGQQKAGPLGYSPLPLNLVQAGYRQVHKIPGAEQKNLDAKGCDNPTFDPNNPQVNRLAATAPFPPACDKAGQGPCGAGGGGGGGGAGGGGGGAGGGAGGAGGGGAENGGAGGGGTGDPNNPEGGPQVDPVTGEIIGAGDDVGSGSGSSAVATELAANRSATTTMLGVLAAVELVLVLVVPAIVVRSIRRRRAIRAGQEGTS